MTSFEREVDLLSLVSKYLNSPYLASILERVGAISFSYDVEITHYAPAVAGKYHGKPEDCYPDEPEELEFEPMFNLPTLGMCAWKTICDKIDRETHGIRRRYFKALLWLYEDNIVEGFIEHEEEWLEKSAYEEVKRSVEDYF